MGPGPSHSAGPGARKALEFAGGSAAPGSGGGETGSHQPLVRGLQSGARQGPGSRAGSSAGMGRDRRRPRAWPGCSWRSRSRGGWKAVAAGSVSRLSPRQGTHLVLAKAPGPGWGSLHRAHASGYCWERCFARPAGAEFQLCQGSRTSVTSTHSRTNMVIRVLHKLCPRPKTTEGPLRSRAQHQMPREDFHGGGGGRRAKRPSLP